jgi:hypothetical protein
MAGWGDKECTWKFDGETSLETATSKTEKETIG